MKQSTSNVKINLNTASETELATLKDIGTQRAKAIIEYRRRRDTFKSLQQIEEIPGIDRSVAEKLKSQLSVGSSGRERLLSERPPGTPSRQTHAEGHK